MKLFIHNVSTRKATDEKMDKEQKQKKNLIFIDAFIDCESVIIRPDNKRKGGEG